MKKNLCIWFLAQIVPKQLKYNTVLVYTFFAALRRYVFTYFSVTDTPKCVHFFKTDYSTLYILYNHLVQRKSNFWTDSKPVKINILRFNALLELEQIKMIFFLERNCHLIFPCLFNRICFSNKKKFVR